MLPGHATKRPRPRTRYPGALKTSVRPPSLSCSALPRAPGRPCPREGLRTRCDGAVPGRDRWPGSGVFSSPPPSRVLRMGQPYARQTAACSAPSERDAPRMVERVPTEAPTTRRARSSPASETQTKRNAPRRHTHRVTPPPVTQAAATPSSPSTRTGPGRLTSGSCGRSSRPWARSRPRRSCFR